MTCRHDPVAIDGDLVHTIVHIGAIRIPQDVLAELRELGHMASLRAPHQSVNFCAPADVVVIEDGVELIGVNLPIHVVLDLACEVRLVFVDGLIVHNDPVLGRASVEMHIQDFHVCG